MNKNQVIKLLNLSRSDNKHEALIAIRSANKMVPDWAEFFGSVLLRDKLKKQYQGSQMPNEAPTKANWIPTIEEMFDDLGSQDHKFINSLAQQYSERGYLTPKQLGALETFWRRLK